MKPAATCDLSFDRTLGAGLTSVLAAAAGVLGPGMAAVFGRMAL